MAIYPLVRRLGLSVTIVVLSLLLLNGVGLKLLPGWLFKPFAGLSWFAFPQVVPNNAPRELLAGAVYVTGYVQEAVSEVESERTAVETEREAFLAFADSVRRMDASPQPSFDAPTSTVVTSRSDHEQLQTVQEHYRDTVMAVPGYETEYGESLRQNMAAEFGDDLAAAVLDGQQFTPQLKNLLVTQANTAARQRSDLLEAIDGECESLAESRRRFECAEVSFEDRNELELSGEPFESLVAYDCRSRREERRYEKLLAERQRDIHRENRWLRNSESVFLQGYLYRDLDVRFPVLREGLERIKGLRKRRRTVARMVGRLD